MTQALAPIAFFCYNRPDHTRRTLEALKANELASESRLFIFSDGPQDNKESREGVAKVREYIHSIDGFGSVEIIERENNYGCSLNLTEAITQITNEFGRVIVVEDDILTSPYFLRYMNDGLELYKDDEKAGAISAYIFPIYGGKGLPQSYFSNDVGLWGWGTWQRVWKDYEIDGAILLKKIKEAGLEEKINYGVKNNHYTYYLGHLKNQQTGKFTTWDLQVQALLFLQGKYVLKPCRPFSNNIGFDGTGIHCPNWPDYSEVNLPLSDEYTPLVKIPVELDKKADELYFKRLYRQFFLPCRVLRRLRRIIKGMLLKVSKSH